MLSGDNSGFSGTINATASNPVLKRIPLVARPPPGSLRRHKGHQHPVRDRSRHPAWLARRDRRIPRKQRRSDSAVTFEIGGNGESTSFAGQIVDTPPGLGRWHHRHHQGRRWRADAHRREYLQRHHHGRWRNPDSLDASPAWGLYNGGAIQINGASTLKGTGPALRLLWQDLYFRQRRRRHASMPSPAERAVLFSWAITPAAPVAVPGTSSAAPKTGSENQGFNLNGFNASFNVATGTDRH